MTFYFAMTNSWSLLYDEIYGDEPMTDDKIDIITGAGNTASYTTGTVGDFDSFENISIGGSADVYPTREDVPSDLWGVPIPENVKVTTGNIGVTNVPQSANSEDTIHIRTSPPDTDFIYESPDGGKTVTRRPIGSDPHDREVVCGDYFGNDYPMAQNFLADNDDATAHHFGTANVGSVTIKIPEEFQTPGIESDNPRKYKEDEAIKALQDYISTTYGGHYTSKENNVQTLDLIESVGDAESFCRSNAIKYLSRYDKKGQAKRDILKALHYSLLLYHFSGQLKETTTRGYETF